MATFSTPVKIARKSAPISCAGNEVMLIYREANSVSNMANMRRQQRDDATTLEHHHASVFKDCADTATMICSRDSATDGSGRKLIARD